jgi:uncharacterized protein (TIGR02058 family)
MKRLILEIGSGADLYGLDYTKAAVRAVQETLRHSSITLFRALEIDHTEMNVVVTIGVQAPEKVDREQVLTRVPRGNPEVNIVFGGQDIADETGQVTSVVATCAIEAFVPDLSTRFCVI